MQWMKRFWDQNFPGGDYDALGRRKGGGVKTTTTSSPASRTARTKSSAAPGKIEKKNREEKAEPKRY